MKIKEIFDTKNSYDLVHYFKLLLEHETGWKRVREEYVNGELVSITFSKREVQYEID